MGFHSFYRPIKSAIGQAGYSSDIYLEIFCGTFSQDRAGIISRNISWPTWITPAGADECRLICRWR